MYLQGEVCLGCVKIWLFSSHRCPLQAPHTAQIRYHNYECLQIYIRLLSDTCNCLTCYGMFNTTIKTTFSLCWVMVPDRGSIRRPQRLRFKIEKKILNVLKRPDRGNFVALPKSLQLVSLKFASSQLSKVTIVFAEEKKKKRIIIWIHFSQDLNNEWWVLSKFPINRNIKGRVFIRLHTGWNMILSKRHMEITLPKSPIKGDTIF